MKTCFVCFPADTSFARDFLKGSDGELVVLNYRQFPDAESYLRLEQDLSAREVAVICTLDRPDTKTLALIFLARLLKDLKVSRLGLITPYLAYMRQDKVFHTGEALTSSYFASLLSQHFDWMITVDPHLHRRKSLSEIYSIPTAVVHSAPLVAAWINKEIQNPVLVGPDEESSQWVKDVAERAKCPYDVVIKQRHGDRDVSVSMPHLDRWKDHTPVLVDDIVSSGRTMIETVLHLKQLGLKSPVCIAVHPIFAGESYSELLKLGVQRVISCKTITHQSGFIEVGEWVLNAAKEAGFIS